MTATPRCTRRDGALSTGCRCSPECVELNRAYDRLRGARKRAGAPARVPAEGARRLIQQALVEHPSWTATQVAEACGVSRRTVRLLLEAGQGREVNLATYLRLQRLSHPTGLTVLGRRSVSGVPARRMVDALLVAGFPLRFVAEQAGLSQTTLSTRNLIPAVSADTEAAVRAVFKRYRFLTGPSKSTAAKARAAGYAPWAVWGGRGIEDVTARVDLEGLDPQWARLIRARQRALLQRAGLGASARSVGAA